MFPLRSLLRSSTSSISTSLFSLRRLTPLFSRQTYRSISLWSATRASTSLLARLGNAAASKSIMNAGRENSSTALGQVRGMKTRSSVKRLCDGCKPVRRKNRVYIIW
ncbi:54S ribosomal protein L36, mitochondrial [Onygenales sp. PD_10]|nr:54S ribosomal protein L36, mitochondrial [Onygenales sp. PD_10]